MTAMFAPSRLPPCVTRLDTEERCRSTLIGPQADPCVVEMDEPEGLISDSEKPVPRRISAPSLPPRGLHDAFHRAPRGKTKYAERVPAQFPCSSGLASSGRTPARPSPDRTLLQAAPGLPLLERVLRAGAERAFATLRNMPSGVSASLPAASLTRYRFSRTTFALSEITAGLKSGVAL